ncbi:MAG TPA: GNAT family N-acetyltransferase [Halanaerobiales bacterium]|nr:GNAT family N-acetyltransferase [Halanaerobiales bacterium]
MEIREMKIKDYQKVYSLWEETDIILKKSDEKQEIDRMLKRNPYTCLVGLRDDEIVSVVMGGFDGRRGYVHHLAVKPELQGQGLGREMMDELMNRFEELKVIKVHLFVEENNKDVKAFYRNIGFEERTDLTDFSKTLIK